MIGDFSEAVQNFDIVDYLSEKGQCRRVSKTHHMCVPCPVCGDTRKDKFYINADEGEKRGRWNSYCCHDAGDISALLEKVEGITRKQANYRIFSTMEGSDDRPIPLSVAPQLLSQPSLLLPGELLSCNGDTPIVVNGQQKRLVDRGITPDIIARHKLAVTSSMPVMNGELRMEYAHRLFIPVFNHNGDGSLIAWQLRDLTGIAHRKYLFPEADKTSTTLYGWQQARMCETVLVVEGVIGKWAWDTAGSSIGSSLVENMAVATFGKKMSEDQIGLLMDSPNVKTVIMGWDLDAAKQIVKICDKISGRKRVRIMPASEDGRDHDELSIPERISLISSAEDYTYSLAAKLKTRAALMGV